MRRAGAPPVVVDDYGVAAVVTTALSRLTARYGPEAAHSIRLGKFIVRGARCVLPDEPAIAVARIMAEGRCDALPVVSTSGGLLGLVTATDVVAAVARGTIPVMAGADS